MPETSGASKKDIFNEPHWTKTHSHRVGLRDGDDRFPGLTHTGDDWRFEIQEEAEEKIEELKEKAARGKLLTVRDFIAKQEVSSSVYLQQKTEKLTSFLTSIAGL